MNEQHPESSAVPAAPIARLVPTTAASPEAPVVTHEIRPVPLPQPRRLRVYGHSTIVYWWPVWLVGFVMAAVTYWWGQPHLIGADREVYYPSSNLGVFYFLTLFGVILFTNVSVRGLASGLMVMMLVLVTLFIAYFGWWDAILGWFGDLKIHLNFGAYFWFSSLLFATWLVWTLIVDHLSYWELTPGQVVHQFVFGAGSKSYDTKGMVLKKHRDDLIQNWLLGLGSGNLVIRTSGATQEEIELSNVLLVGRKLDEMQRIIAQEPVIARP